MRAGSWPVRPARRAARRPRRSRAPRRGSSAADRDPAGAGVVGEPAGPDDRSSRGHVRAGPRRRPSWPAGTPGTRRRCPGRPGRCPSRRPSGSGVRPPARRRRRAAIGGALVHGLLARGAAARARRRRRRRPRRRPATASATSATVACSRSSTTASAPTFSRSATWSGLRTMPTGSSPRSASCRLEQQGDLAVSAGDDDAHGAPSSVRDGECRVRHNTSGPDDSAVRPAGNLPACPAPSPSSPTPRLAAAEVAARRGIIVVPLQVVIGARCYDEGVDAGATPETVAEALREWTPVSTSRPTPAAMLEAYEKAAATAAPRSCCRSTCPGS